MKKLLTIALAAVMLVSVMAGCGSSGGGSASTSTAAGLTVVKVASVTPLSGSQAVMGETIKNGAQLALEQRVEEFKALGIDLKFEPQDDQADPKVGVAVAQRLVDDKAVIAVVGHYNSGVAIPSSEVYKTDNLAMVSPANTAVAVTERGIESVMRICVRDDVQGPAAADFAKDTLGAKNAFVIHDKTAYGQGIADEFKARFQATGTVSGYEGITAGEADFSAVLNKVVAAKPDIVYFGGMYPEGSLLIKQMKEKGVTAKFMGPDGMDSSEVVKIAGDSAIGVYYTTVAADMSGEAGKKFKEAFKAKFGTEAENFTGYGYDAMNVTLDAIKTAAAANGGKVPSREQVVKAARATSGFKGAATNVTFNAKGDNEEAAVGVFEFKEAKYPAELVKTILAKDYLK